MGVRIDITTTANSRSLFIGFGVVEGAQGVFTFGAAEGSAEGFTIKSNVSAGLGQTLQGSGTISEAGGGFRITTGRTFGYGASASPIVVGYTFTSKRFPGNKGGK